MQKWEYDFRTLGIIRADGLAKVRNVFNRLGNGGWELVGIWDSDIAIFKRPIEVENQDEECEYFPGRTFRKCK